MRRRLRKRVASLERRSVPPSRLAGFLSSAGLPAGKIGRHVAVVVLGGAAGGAAAFGSAGVVVGVPVALAGSAALIRRRAATRNERLEAEFPLAVRAMSDTVRAGGNVRQAIAQAAGEASSPMREELQQAVAEMNVGVPIDDVLRSLADRCRVAGSDVLAIALNSAVRSGADVRPVLDCIVEAAVDRRRLRRELRAATAQGRMTALVIGLLPAAFLLIMGAGGGRELRFLFREPAGWALIGAGLALEAAGFAWIRRLGKARA